MQNLRPSKGKFEKALRTIVNKNDAQHRENSARLIDISNQVAIAARVMQDHMAADAIQFAATNASILEVNRDVKSLLSSRSFLRGTWFAIVTVSTLVGVIAGLVVAWYR
jgi:hypothetical protein